MVDKETIEAIEAELAYWEKKAEVTDEPLYKNVAIGVRMSLNAIERHEVSQAIKLHAELEWQKAEAMPIITKAFEGKLYETLD